MSSYYQETKNPKTGKWEKAEWLDDYFGSHQYGVRFPDMDFVFDPTITKLKTRESSFVTKDSGKRVEFETGARRDTSSGKPRFDLLSPFALQRVASLMERGAVKYGEGNWEKGIPEDRCYESMLRHAYQYRMGDIEEDHLAAVVFNALAIMHYQEKGINDKK